MENTENKKYITIIQEDECAPDARQYFEVKLIEMTGLTIREFKGGSNVVEDLYDSFVYKNGEFELVDEIGIHKLRKLTWI